MSIEYAMTRLDYYLDQLASWVVKFTDHYILDRRITLSEGFLFVTFLVCSMWFTAFGVSFTGALRNGFAGDFWVPIFWVLTIAHFASFFFKNLHPRAIIVGIYAVVWSFVAILLLMVGDLSSPAIPTYLAFAWLAVCISVRLTQERKGRVVG